MTHQALVNLLKDVAEAVNIKGGWVDGSRSDGGIHSVSTGAEGVTPKFPLIHLYSIGKTPIDRVENNQTWNIVMAFWQQDDLQNVPTQTNTDRETIINEMEVLCEAFMDALFLETVQIESENQTPETLQLAGTVSGWSVSFNLADKTGC